MASNPGEYPFSDDEGIESETAAILGLLIEASGVYFWHFNRPVF